MNIVECVGEELENEKDIWNDELLHEEHVSQRVYLAGVAVLTLSTWHLRASSTKTHFAHVFLTYHCVFLLLFSDSATLKWQVKSHLSRLVLPSSSLLLPSSFQQLLGAQI